VLLSVDYQQTMKDDDMRNGPMTSLD